jgi:hypothetical protein
MTMTTKKQNKGKTTKTSEEIRAKKQKPAATQKSLKEEMQSGEQVSASAELRKSPAAEESAVRHNPEVAKAAEPDRGMQKETSRGADRPSSQGRSHVSQALRNPVRADRPRADLPGIRKEYLQSGDVCRATFRLPGQAAPRARKVTIVGEFNDWDRESIPMVKLENGDFAVTLEIRPGKEYRFRYLIDGQKWENDWHADKYVKGPFGNDDSVVCA